MCMEYLINEHTRQTIAYKVLKYSFYYKEWMLPYFPGVVEKVMLAAGKIIPIIDSTTNKVISKWNGEGGAIHCFKTKQFAKEYIWNQFNGSDEYFIFKVRGKTVVGHNDRQIAFKQITFDIDPTNCIVKSEFDFCDYRWKHTILSKEEVQFQC